MKTFFIGSLPHQSAEAAIEFVKNHASHLPFLPQLPGVNSQEDMVGQVLRGFEWGGWDEKASISLSLFWKEFREASRAKLQIAGPMTVGCAMSMDFEEIVPQWISLWGALVAQWESARMRGELWLQIDEPSWSAERALPHGYERFLKAIRERKTGMKIGIHSCAELRPQVSRQLCHRCDFLSFDFSNTPMSVAEEQQWRGVL